MSVAATGIIEAQLALAVITKGIFEKAISDTAQSIYLSIYDVINFEDPKVNAVLVNSDISNKIEITELLIRDIEIKNEAVNMCLEKIHDSILNIREDLKKIKKALSEHKELYFKYFRRIYKHQHIESLKIHIEQFNTRMKLLIDIITVYKVEK